MCHQVTVKYLNTDIQVLVITLDIYYENQKPTIQCQKKIELIIGSVYSPALYTWNIDIYMPGNISKANT